MTVAHQDHRPRIGWRIVLGVLAVVVLIVVAGAVKVDGKPLIENATSLLVQIVASAGLVLVAALPLLKRTERQAAAAALDAGVAKEQTTNSHKTNLREELDERHEELIHLFKTQGGQIEHIVETQRSHGDDIRGIKSDQRGIRRDIGRNSDMIVSMGETLATHTSRLHEIDLLNEALPRAGIMRLLAAEAAADMKGTPTDD